MTPVEMLKQLVEIAYGRGPGTNVDRQWMGVPDWEIIEQAAEICEENGLPIEKGKEPAPYGVDED